jgi:hypothetical protein
MSPMIDAPVGRELPALRGVAHGFPRDRSLLATCSARAPAQDPSQAPGILRYSRLSALSRIAVDGFVADA